MPTSELKLIEWIFEKGLSYGLSIYFVWFFTTEIKPSITQILSKMTEIINDRQDIKEILQSKIDTLEKVNKLERGQERLESKIDAIAMHVEKCIR